MKKTVMIAIVFITSAMRFEDCMQIDFHQAVAHFAVALDQVEHGHEWSKQSRR